MLLFIVRQLVGHPEVQKSMFTACLRIKNHIIRRSKLKYQIFSGALELYGTIEEKSASNILQEISARAAWNVYSSKHKIKPK